MLVKAITVVGGGVESVNELVMLLLSSALVIRLVLVLDTSVELVAVLVDTAEEVVVVEDDVVTGGVVHD